MTDTTLCESPPIWIRDQPYVARVVLDEARLQRELARDPDLSAEFAIRRALRYDVAPAGEGA